MLMATAKTTKTTKKTKKVAKARAVHAVRSNKVDYNPNKMTWVISALGGAILVLLAVIVVTNQF